MITLRIRSVSFGTSATETAELTVDYRHLALSSDVE
jgi:hypothetical protein